MKKLIHVVITGGTIDSYYEGTKDTAIPNEKSVLPRFIASLKLYTELIFTEVCMKDSRNLTPHDLKHILETIEISPASLIIITHGTYTMPDTARYLQANLKRKDQTIIITGSMVPLVGFSPSDAPFNLGYAFSEINHLSNGIYISMNGRTFFPNEVLKILSEGRFSSIFGENQN